MRPTPNITAAKRVDPIELMLGRPLTCWDDYVEAGGYEFDKYFTDSAGKPSPWQPGSRTEYAQKFALMECPAALRRAKLAAAREVV